jgi:hypothetical protein
LTVLTILTINRLGFIILSAKQIFCRRFQFKKVFRKDLL